MEIAIAVCNADDFRCEMVRTLALMTYYQGRAGHQIKLIFPEGPYIDQNANSAMKAAKNSNSDWLFLLEIDVEYLLNADIIGFMIEQGKDVISGPYYQGIFPYRPIVYEFTPETMMKNFSLIPDGLFKADSAGTGFLLISKKVIQAFTDEVIAEIGEPFDFLMDGNKIKLRQDGAFSWRIKQLGFESWVHGNIPLAHIKKQKITKELFEASKKMIESGVV